MITVKTPLDKDFNYQECEKLYLENYENLQATCDFKTLLEQTFFYSFSDDDTFLGCVFYFQEDEKLFIGAFGTRGHHLKNIECAKQSFSWWNCDIYAKSIR